MEDLVSVIMPAYNCAKYIGEAIESVINQTYQNWELIIVNDCSTDGTELVVKKYMSNEPRLRYIKLSINAGAAVARNTAMSNAQGQYIAFLDSDDFWLKNKLEKQLLFMKINHYSFTWTNVKLVDESSHDTGKIYAAGLKADYRSTLYSNAISNSAAVYHAGKLGIFQGPDIRKRNDMALWLMILQKEKYAYRLDEVLSAYRVRKNSITEKKFDLIRYHWRLYRQIAGLSVIQSIWHMGYWMVDKSVGKGIKT